MAILAILASLFGCGKHDPYILDGPGMVYVDSEYRNFVSLIKNDAELAQAAHTGEAFALRCSQDVIVNIFETKEINYLLSVTETGGLQGTDENVWDITNIDEILKK